MTYGRKVCNTLKEIRQQIADKNEIEYTAAECNFEGECIGTCPKCESEVKYIENELHRRKQIGKAVAVAGISLGMVGTFSACNIAKQQTHLQDNTPIIQTNLPIFKQEIATDTIVNDTVFNATIKGKVLDKDSKMPVDFAAVRLMQGDKLVFGTVTDEKGEFTLTPIPFGKYDFIVACVGYKHSILKNIEIKDNSIKIMNDIMIESANMPPVYMIGAVRSPIDFDYPGVGRTKFRQENGRFELYW